MDLKPDPIKLLNILKIVRNPSQQDLGPWFYVDARKTPLFIEVSLCLVCPQILLSANKVEDNTLTRGGQANRGKSLSQSDSL